MRNYHSGKLRRTKKQKIIVTEKDNTCGLKIFSCSFKQSIPYEIWSTKYHRNRKHLAFESSDYFLDNDFVNVESLLYHWLDSGRVSDFYLFGLLMKWGKDTNSRLGGIKIE